MKHSIYPRTIEKTERIEVIIEAPGDYALFVDGEYIRSFDNSAVAFHTGAMRLEEEARDLAAGLAGQSGVRV